MALLAISPFVGRATPVTNTPGVFVTRRGSLATPEQLVFVVLAGLFQSGEGPCFMLSSYEGAATWVLADARKLLDCCDAALPLLAMTEGETDYRVAALLVADEGETDCCVAALPLLAMTGRGMMGCVTLLSLGLVTDRLALFVVLSAGFY